MNDFDLIYILQLARKMNTVRQRGGDERPGSDLLNTVS